MNSTFNLIALALIAVVALISVFFIFKKDTEHDEDEEIIDRYSIKFLSINIRNIFNEILNQNIAELYLNRTETIKREQQKSRLNKALRSCAHGNIGEKEYVKDYIKDILQQKLDINERTIDKVLYFNEPDKLSTQDKFEILLYQQKKQYGRRGFEELNELCGFDKEKKSGTVYTTKGQKRCLQSI